jgi:hypothetical protein
LIYFGYPQAHEDDAERAVRAGLELVAAVGGLKTRAVLQARSIATGWWSSGAPQLEVLCEQRVVIFTD